MLKNAESFQRCYIGNQNLMGFTEKQSVNDHGKAKDTLILGAGKPHGSDQLFLKAGNILHVSLTAKDLVRSYRVPG